MGYGKREREDDFDNRHSKRQNSGKKLTKLSHKNMTSCYFMILYFNMGSYFCQILVSIGKFKIKSAFLQRLKKSKFMIYNLWEHWFTFYSE